jgi:two-component system, chemotaxis family, CheB/CheR fusion protein
VTDALEETVADRGDGFEPLLEFIRENRGFDFTGYKRPTLRRRIAKRMETVDIGTFPDYQAYLEANGDEFAHLFDTILINVTGFFRDPPTWEFLAQEVAPQLAADAGADGAIRVWSTGCASGEEAYSIAIVLAETLGDEAFRHRVKVYATDVDEDALTFARHAAYGARQLEGLPEELRERYFEPVNGDYVFRSDLRRSVIFGRHDLVRDPPISRVDLLLARNTLMYFNPQLQAKILGDFHFALDGGGYLVLGKSEMLLTRTRLFQPLDLKRRVFVKSSPGPRTPRPFAVDHERERSPVVDETSSRELQDAGFEGVPAAQLVVDQDGVLAMANAQARRLFALAPSDLGKPLQDLELSYRPVELRSRIDEVRSGRHLVALREVEWPVGGEVHWFDVQLSPVHGSDGADLGVGITFTDVTRYRRLNETVEASRGRLETAYDDLQSTTEELETTNEELQSTNEELETTNEELQSTNEELETMNEELQSTNEELETMNDELRLRTEQLDDLNEFLEAVLGSLGSAVLVVDRELVVRAWNGEATELWGVREDEALGRHVANLDIGLPLADVVSGIRRALEEADTPPIEMEGVNRRGRRVRCLVHTTPLRGASGVVRGVIVRVEASEGP